MQQNQFKDFDSLCNDYLDSPEVTYSKFYKQEKEVKVDRKRSKTSKRNDSKRKMAEITNFVY